MVRHLNHKDLKNIYFDSLHFILRQVITHAKFLLEATTGGNLYKKNVLRCSQNSPTKHLCQSLFFNKVTGISPAPILQRIHSTHAILWTYTAYG